MKATAVVLAAGEARRMGKQKLLLEVGGVPILGRVLAACEHLPTVVVGAPSLRAFVEERGARFIANIVPEWGMAHSLALGDAKTDADSPLLVLLGDKPLVTRALVERVLAEATGADICFPQHEGVGGHPVYLSVRARKRIARLPRGDSIHLLRDDPTLQQRVLEIAEIGAYTDVDDFEALERLRARAGFESP
ncbi:MAG: nucleotidyltransferase family protein [Candidatus Baltobacteraceae bacterium]